MLLELGCTSQMAAGTAWPPAWRRLHYAALRLARENTAFRAESPSYLVLIGSAQSLGRWDALEQPSWNQSSYPTRLEICASKTLVMSVPLAVFSLSSSCLGESRRKIRPCSAR